MSHTMHSLVVAALCALPLGCPPIILHSKRAPRSAAVLVQLLLLLGRVLRAKRAVKGCGRHGRGAARRRLQLLLRRGAWAGSGPLGRSGPLGCGRLLLLLLRLLWLPGSGPCRPASCFGSQRGQRRCTGGIHGCCRLGLLGGSCRRCRHVSLGDDQLQLGGRGCCRGWCCCCLRRLLLACCSPLGLERTDGRCPSRVLAGCRRRRSCRAAACRGQHGERVSVVLGVKYKLCAFV